MLQDTMKNPKIRRIVVIVGTTALFGAAGSTTNATSNTTAAGGTARQQGAPAGRPGGPSAADLPARSEGHMSL
jgi:hypothetical protein